LGRVKATTMDTTRARELVALESRRIEATLTELADDLAMDAELEVQQTGDDDAGNGLATEMTERALQSDYLLRLAAVERAEARIAAGTFGRSVETGALIPDQRLDAYPLAERTVEEQRRFEAESAFG
jgi:DnaK suppressor protein